MRQPAEVEMITGASVGVGRGDCARVRAPRGSHTTRGAYMRKRPLRSIGKASPYTEGLPFDARRDDTVDEVTMTPMMKSAAEQAAEAVRSGGERS